MLTLYVCQPQHTSWVVSAYYVEQNMVSATVYSYRGVESRTCLTPPLTRQVFMSKEFFLTVLRASVRSFSWSSVPATLPPFDYWEGEGGGLYGGWVGGWVHITFSG